jgi:hypothetical protein
MSLIDSTTEYRVTKEEIAIAVQALLNGWRMSGKNGSCLELDRIEKASKAEDLIEEMHDYRRRASKIKSPCS